MAEVVFRQEAIDDLKDIWTYTYEAWSEEQADKYYQTLEIACIQIGRLPQIGKSFEGIIPNLLGYSIGKHIIFYHLTTKDEIEVIRILHERMDLKNRLSE